MQSLGCPESAFDFLLENPECLYDDMLEESIAGTQPPVPAPAAVAVMTNQNPPPPVEEQIRTRNSDGLNQNISRPSTPEIPMRLPSGTNTSESSTKRRKFRLSSKRLLLTYPQCTTDKHVVLGNIRNTFQEILEFAVVAREQHESGDPHLHCLVQLSRRTNYKDPHCLDHIARQHGSYEAVKNFRAALEYVIKDGEYVFHGEDPLSVLKRLKGHQDSKSDTIARRFLEGASLEDVNEEYPGYVLMHKRKLEEYASWVQVKRRKLELLPWPTITVSPAATATLTVEEEIKVWLAENIRRDDRPHTARNLYIYGRTCMGKTTFAYMLTRYLSVYWVPMDEEFYDANINEYDVAIMDEFRAQKRIQWMNQFCQGFPMTLRCKGTQVLKTKNIPVIVLSNYALEENYKNTDAAIVDTLRRRFLVIHLTSPINIQL